jgi:hypothetical protein
MLLFNIISEKLLCVDLSKSRCVTQGLTFPWVSGCKLRVYPSVWTCVSVADILIITLKQKYKENERTNPLRLSTVSKHHALSLSLSLSYPLLLQRDCVLSVWSDFISMFVQGLVRVLVHGGPNFNSSNRNFPLYPTTLRTLPLRDVP